MDGTSALYIDGWETAAPIGQKEKAQLVRAVSFTQLIKKVIAQSIRDFLGVVERKVFFAPNFLEPLRFNAQSVRNVNRLHIIVQHGFFYALYNLRLVF